MAWIVYVPNTRGSHAELVRIPTDVKDVSNLQ
jgi:hypothetical protein